MGQGLMVKLDFESRLKCDQPGERFRSSGAGAGSGSGMPRVFVGSNSKGLYDVGSIDSPTSPLDLMMFPRLRDAIRSPRDLPPRQNSWDCVKLGLRSIMDSPIADDDDERNLFGGTSGSSQGKSIVFAPKLRNKDSVAVSIPQGQDGLSLRQSNSSVVFEIGETRFEVDQFRNLQSCPADYCSFEKYCPPLIRKGPGDSSLFAVEGSAGHLRGSDIELSEDYTCVITHGPGATTTTTHIYDDRVLEGHLKDSSSKTIAEPVEEINHGLNLLNGFLRTCYGCKKPLEDGEDIYIYRGDKAFCREECRMKEILLEGDPEEILLDSSDSRLCGIGNGLF
ncbi:hypothetical protein MLD38_015427 [Melastoma candidum]|uniref:Uncharacterized protein n=1 Tax=Melastoma candidum TaxID=119954 RepID=A0ACB9RG28_9MYRT|nr:hypothetical protein MLD38_015427 [Melastoma candidum]